MCTLSQARCAAQSTVWEEGWREGGERERGRGRRLYLWPATEILTLCPLFPLLCLSCIQPSCCFILQLWNILFFESSFQTIIQSITPLCECAWLLYSFNELNIGCPDTGSQCNPTTDHSHCVCHSLMAVLRVSRPVPFTGRGVEGGEKLGKGR